MRKNVIHGRGGADLCRLESGAEWSTPLIWNQGEQPWVLTLSGHQGVPGGGLLCSGATKEREGGREGGPVGVMLCLLNSGEAAPSDVPLRCRTGPRDPGSKGRKRGGRGWRGPSLTPTQTLTPPHQHSHPSPPARLPIRSTSSASLHTNSPSRQP